MNSDSVILLFVFIFVLICIFYFIYKCQIIYFAFVCLSFVVSVAKNLRRWQLKQRSSALLATRTKKVRNSVRASGDDVF